MCYDCCNLALDRLSRRPTGFSLEKEASKTKPELMWSWSKWFTTIFELKRSIIKVTGDKGLQKMRRSGPIPRHAGRSDVKMDFQLKFIF